MKLAGDSCFHVTVFVLLLTPNMIYMCDFTSFSYNFFIIKKMSCWTGFCLPFLPSLRFYDFVAVYYFAREIRKLCNIQQVGCGNTLIFSIELTFLLLIFILSIILVISRPFLKTELLLKQNSHGSYLELYILMNTNLFL